MKVGIPFYYFTYTQTIADTEEGIDRWFETRGRGEKEERL
jgi:hypothetical protein